MSIRNGCKRCAGQWWRGISSKKAAQKACLCTKRCGSPYCMRP